jgi:hypothetical protein
MGSAVGGMIDVNEYTTRWMSGAELVGQLEIGDLVEFSREFITPNQPIYAVCCTLFYVYIFL